MKFFQVESVLQVQSVLSTLTLLGVFRTLSNIKMKCFAENLLTLVKHFIFNVCQGFKQQLIEAFLIVNCVRNLFSGCA